MASVTAPAAATASADATTSSSDSIYTFSSGLVQITGLSTLVGGSGLDELSLGLKAAPGLAWSSVSCFGIFKVIRAFVSGFIPDDAWREVLGLRTSTVDDALGFSFWTDLQRPVMGGATKSSIQSAMHQRNARLAERRGGVWLGIDRKINHEIGHGPEQAEEHLRNQKITGWYSTIAPNRALKNTLAATSSFVDEKEILVHRFIPDHTAHDFWLIDWALLVSSAVKVAEPVTLYFMGSTFLWWSNIVGWAVCFIVATSLHALNCGRDTHSNIHETADLLVGDLPSYKRPGSSNRRIILGQPVSIRESRAWRVAWAICALANAAGFGITFYVLVKELEASTRLVSVWLGFQVLWIVLRTCVYHLIPDSSGVSNVNLSSRSLQHESPASRTRVLRLLLCASLLQTHEHVRIYESYLEDIQAISSPEAVIEILEKAGWAMTHVLPCDASMKLDGLIIEAVVGEELLRTFAWITGAKIDNAEIYDAVTVLVRLKSGEHCLVPGVRVMAGKLIRPTAPDPEALGPSFDRRGTVNKDKTGYWIYWLPLGGPGTSQTQWLEIACYPFRVLGPLREHRILRGDALDKELSAGLRSIGLKSLQDLERAHDASRECFRVMLSTVKSLS